jgi:hypothetical protein
MSWFWYAFGYTAEGHGWQRRAAVLASAAGGPELANALHGLAVLQLQQGQTAEARDALTTCLQIRRETGDRNKTAMELNSLGVAHWSLGDANEGRAMLRESIDIAREIGDETRESTALSNLAVFEITANNCDHAIELLERARAIDERLGNIWGCAVIHSNLAAARLRTGRADEAYASLHTHAASIAGLGDIELTIEIIELLAGAFSQRGDAGRAARLFGTTEALREQAGMPIREPDAALLAEFLAPARDLLSADQWEEERRGRAILQRAGGPGAGWRGRLTRQQATVRRRTRGSGAEDDRQFRQTAEDESVAVVPAQLRLWDGKPHLGEAEKQRAESDDTLKAG